MVLIIIRVFYIVKNDTEITNFDALYLMTVILILM